MHKEKLIPNILYILKFLNGIFCNLTHESKLTDLNSLLIANNTTLIRILRHSTFRVCLLSNGMRNNGH